MPIHNQSALEKRICADLRDMRTKAGVSQGEIADLFGWNRDAVSKMENGSIRVRLADYLAVIRYLRHYVPGHPALALMDYYSGEKRPAD